MLIIVDNPNRLIKVGGVHYSIGLPLRNKDVCMLDNKLIAEQCDLYLKKRLKRDVSLKSEYSAFMKDLISKGYADRVPAEDLGRNDGNVWYTPSQCLSPYVRSSVCL